MNSGFFSTEDTEIIRGDEAPVIRGSNKPLKASCEDCGLSHDCITPHMPLSGKGRRKVLIVGEAPGKEEDRKGTQFVGPSGQLLRDILANLDLDLDRDFWKINAVNCRTPHNETPNPIQIAGCRKNVMEAVERYKPEVIIALGRSAMESLVGPRMTGRLVGLSMTDWAGCQIPDQELKCWICPTWHPSYALREWNDGKGNKIAINQMQAHIAAAMGHVDQPFYVSNYSGDCLSITDAREAVSFLKDFRPRLRNSCITMDYETTGRKPHREGHRIVAASVSDGCLAWAFPFFDDEDFRSEWRKLMMDPRVGKIGHNIKFEDTWTYFRAGNGNRQGYWIENVAGCTMLRAHSLDNRKRTGLKFCVYAALGVAGYDDAIDPYLECTKREEELYGANGFNLIDRAPMDQLLLYNAMDSLVTYKLWENQEARLTPHQRKGVVLFNDLIQSFAEAESHGLHINLAGVEEQRELITARMDRLETRIAQMPELKQWDRPKSYRPGNPNDLTHLLFDCLGYTPTKFTDEAQEHRAGDKDALADFDLPIVKKTLEWRRWQKVRDTYIKGITKETVDGLMRAFFNLHTVDTFRSSSDSFNFQNVPKRDKQVARVLRLLMSARPGHRLGEYDYKAIEAGIVACYNQDPNWVRYFNDPKSDMHRDMAAKLFLRETTEVTKEERQGAKNGFVFPTVYGSWFKNTAATLWGAAEPTTLAHLADKGIENLDDFTQHVRKVEKWFWEDQFPVGYEWMNKTIKDYDKKGYIDLYTGFRCYGPMSRNQIINYRIQGSAFHCLGWTFTNTSKELRRRNMDTYLIGQVHDCIVPDIHPEEEAEVDQIIIDYGTKKIREHWPWISVNLRIEKAVSEVNGSWADMTTDDAFMECQS